MDTQPQVLSASDLRALVSKHGSAYAASKALGISPQAFYERLTRKGITDRVARELLPGEPVERKDRKVWLSSLLKEHGTVVGVAKALGRSNAAINDRITRYCIRRKPRKTFTQKRSELKGLVATYGTAYSAAQAIGITPSAFYERLDRVNLRLRKG